MLDQSTAPEKLPSASTTTLASRILDENISMAKFALSKGMKVSSKVMKIIGKHERLRLEEKWSESEVAAYFQELNDSHKHLSGIIDPIKPGSCHLIITEAEKNGFWNIFGAVPMARKMAFIAFFSLIAMLSASLSADVSEESLVKGILNNEGLVLLKNLAFLLSTASLGSAFALLFKINRELQDGGYEEDDDASYISTWIMGMAAGMILAEMIPTQVIAGEDGAGGAEMGKLILALIGGFASSMVYNILNTIVDTLGSAFNKDNRVEIASESKRLKTELNQQQTLKDMEMAGKLNSLSQLVKNGADSDALNEELSKVMEQLTGEAGVPSDS